MENLSNNLPDVDRWAWLWFSMITISGCMAMTLCRVHTGAMGPCRVSDDHAYPGVPEDAASVARHIWHCSMNSLWLAPFVPWPECLGIFVASCVLYTVCRYRCPKKEMRIWFHNFCEFVFSDDSISNSQPSMSLWFGTQCIRNFKLITACPRFIAIGTCWRPVNGIVTSMLWHGLLLVALSTWAILLRTLAEIYDMHVMNYIIWTSWLSQLGPFKTYFTFYMVVC